MLYRLRPLLAALVDRDAATRELRWPWITTIIGFLITLGLIGGLAYSVWMYWPTLLFSDVLGGSLFSALVPWLVLYRIPLDIAIASQATSSDPTLLAFALRRALETNDVVIAPVAVDESVASAPMSETTLTLANPTPLILPRAQIVVANVLGILLLGGCAMTVAIMAMVLNLPVQQFITASSSDLLIPATVAGALLLCALLCFVVGARLQRRRSKMRHGISLSIDSLGITYHQPVWAKRSTTITWADMRKLAQFTYIDNLTRTHLVYLLDSDAHTLLWEVPPDDRYGPANQRELIATRQESGRALALFIRERTRLPLHDLSETMAQIVGRATSNLASVPFLRRAYNVALAEKDVAGATALWHAAAPGAREPRALRKLTESSHMPPRISAPANAPATPYTLPASSESSGVNRVTARVNTWLASTVAQQQAMMKVARALLPHLPTTDHVGASPSMQRYLRSVSRRRAMTMGIVWMQFALLVCILLGVGFFWLSERQVDRQIRSVPQQIQAEKPTYFAPLTSQQADWTTTTPTKTDPAIGQFVHGSYHVASQDPTQSCISWIPTDPGSDLAIAVTVNIHEQTKNSTSTAGMMFDVADDGNTFSAFGVDPSGDWILYDFNSVLNPQQPWTTVDTGTSDAIQRGDGATSTLMVVRHGPLYLLYVNNTLVERFYDSRHQLTPGGYVGVYIDYGDISADFNDFTIYPVPAQLAAIPLTTDVPFWLTR